MKRLQMIRWVLAVWLMSALVSVAQTQEAAAQASSGNWQAIERACAFWGAAQVDRSLATVEEVLKADPNDVWALALRGAIRSARGDWAEAIKDINAAEKAGLGKMRITAVSDGDAADTTVRGAQSSIRRNVQWVNLSEALVAPNPEQSRLDEHLKLSLRGCLVVLAYMARGEALEARGEGGLWDFHYALCVALQAGYCFPRLAWDLAESLAPMEQGQEPRTEWRERAIELGCRNLRKLTLLSEGDMALTPAQAREAMEWLSGRIKSAPSMDQLTKETAERLVKLYRLRALLQNSLGDRKAALTDMKAALELAPDDYKCRVLHGELAAEDGDEETAFKEGASVSKDAKRLWPEVIVQLSWQCVSSPKRLDLDLGRYYMDKMAGWYRTLGTRPRYARLVPGVGTLLQENLKPVFKLIEEGNWQEAVSKSLAIVEMRTSSTPAPIGYRKLEEMIVQVALEAGSTNSPKAASLTSDANRIWESLTGVNSQAQLRLRPGSSIGLPECIDVQMAVLMKKKYLEFCQPRDGGTPEAAMALYDQALALELKPEFRPAVFLSRAELWRKRGQPAKAMEDYAKAVELAAANEQLRPVYADMLNGIACRLLAEAGGGAMAVTVAEKACALQKKAEFLDTVARAQAETGDFAKAAQTEREAAQLAKDEPQQAAVFELRADGFGEKLAVGKQVERTKSLWLSLAAKEAPARKAWREVMECYRPPMLPVEWEWKSPSNEATAAWNQKRAAQLVAGADLAKQFYVRFSDDQTMRQARFYEVCFLNKAFILGEKKVRDRLVALEQEMLKDSGAPAEDKRAIRRYPVERVLLEVPFNEDEAVKLARGAVADFPEDQEAWTLFIRIALQSNRSREAMVNEAKESKVGKVILDAARQRTGGVWLDNPISLRFTALDGREVDLAKMRGKVVLLFFWATWAPPAVRWELPKILPVYEELNSKGFDVIGISCDEDKGQLQQFVTDKKLPWPQHFDGKRSYEILAKYDIKQIPTLWLVDKKGILRDVNGREGLEEKVKRLLAE